MKTNVRAVSVLCLCTIALNISQASVLDFRNAEIANGKVYRQGANAPFSGKVTNMPLERLINNQGGYFKVMPMIFSGTGTPAPGILLQGLMAYSNGLLAICDADFTDGQMDGLVQCRKEKTGERLLKIQFKRGMLNGPFNFYGNVATANVNFQQGHAQGQMAIRMVKSGKLIHTYQLQNGLLHGREAVLNEQTGAVTSYANYVNGSMEGQIVRLTPDGKQIIYQGTMANNQQHGPEKFFYPSGQLMKTGQWEKGVPEGLFQYYDEQGKSTKQELWKYGVKHDPVVYAKGQCVREKIEAFEETNRDPDMVRQELRRLQDLCYGPSPVEQ